MVLVGNEWQNKCEDVPKTTVDTTTTDGTNTTTGATTSTTTSSSTSANTLSFSLNTPGTGDDESITNISSSTVTPELINSITIKKAAETDVIASESPAITLDKSLVNDNTNNEQKNEINKDNSVEIAYKSKLNDDYGDINECKISEVGKLFSSTENCKEENLDDTFLKHINSFKIMAENIKETPVKEENEDQELQTLIHNHYADNNKDHVETNLCFNSNATNNTNTLTLPTHRENNRQQELVTNDLCSALQTALNATNNANNSNISVAAAGLQPNFLSQLSLTANVAGLQKSTNSSTSTITAKQINNSFSMLDSHNQNLNDSNLLENTASSTSVPASTYDNNGQAKIILICEGNSHPFQTRTVCLTPNVECMVGRLIAKSKASESNAIFDCKVLSRKHAVIWYTPDGKFWVKDTKSSNGTFINDNKLGEEEAELHFGDIVKFGVDVLENSRKEVHGCIIACVKLYMPDGREAISIESSAHRSQFTGEGRISYDELHRLNLYIQETTQREKLLTSKLCNIQNVLDATRKKSALCWQSMITEDQLLHRIHSLEKKLQFMEKNVPDNVLRNEVLKLLDDKSSYQHSAKEALRKVYQERCDAMQMLAKMESAYSQSDNECSVLRDQIMNSKQTLQDVNARLLRLETDYNDFKDEVARQQQEAKDREEQRITELTEKLHERELECEDLKKKISELLIKRAELLEDEEQLLEKQAMEKLDAAIADIDLGDDEDSSDEDENDEVDVKNKEKFEAKRENKLSNHDHEVKFPFRTKKHTSRPQLASIFGDTLNEDEEKNMQENAQPKISKMLETTSTNKSPPKRVKETTIMKWLQNSDLNKNEGSLDIFKAICNENENDDDASEGNGILPEQELKSTQSLKIPETTRPDETNLFSNCYHKLRNVQKNLKQLESEIENEMKNNKIAKYNIQNYESSDEDEDEDDGACGEEEFLIKRNGNTIRPSVENQVLTSKDKKYLLKSSVDMLTEAYNEIWDSLKEKDSNNDSEKIQPSNVTSISQSPTTITKQLGNITSPVRYPESDNTESDSEVESLTLASPVVSSVSGTVVDAKTKKTNDHLLQEKLKEYQSQVETLNEKLQQTEMDAQHTLEIMQVECDDVKLKMETLNQFVESLKSDKCALEQAINQNNTPTIEAKLCEETDTQLQKDLEFEEDPILNAINATALEREEELITYKERLDEQQKANIDLRHEIALLKLKVNAGSTKDLWLKKYLPCSVIILAIIIYFVTTYY